MAHILVVDDHETVRRMISLILKGVGHTVSEARDGVHALEVLQDIIPDIVLTDIDMPRMNGKKLLAHVRAQFPGMPCLGMSWDSEGTDFDSFIKKPFDIQELIEMVGHILERWPVKG